MMKNEADETSNTPPFPIETYAEGFADLGLALAFPSFCPDNLERFKAGLDRMQEAFGDDIADVLWFAVTTFALDRGPTADELRALGLPDRPDGTAVRETIARAIEDKLTTATQEPGDCRAQRGAPADKATP